MTTPELDITVAICTYNRSALLEQTLSAMTALDRGSLRWELIVVDNNCTDGTPQVISQFRDRLPLRAVEEKVPGQSAARNRAIAEARGTLLLWTDDDVLVAPSWLTSYWDAAVRFPRAGVFGGPIQPWFDGHPPRWLEEVMWAVGGAYAVRDLGKGEVDLVFPERMPFGANMAFRTEAQRAVPYDTRLGLRPGSDVRGEETDVIARVLAEGWEGRWVPNATVRHFIPSERQTLQYLRRYFRGYGQFLAATERGGKTATILGRPRWAVRRALEAYVRFALARATSASASGWIEPFKAAQIACGYLQAPATRVRLEAGAIDDRVSV